MDKIQIKRGTKLYYFLENILSIDLDYINDSCQLIRKIISHTIGSIIIFTFVLTILLVEISSIVGLFMMARGNVEFPNDVANVIFSVIFFDIVLLVLFAYTMGIDVYESYNYSKIYNNSMDGYKPKEKSKFALLLSLWYNKICIKVEVK